MSRRTAIVSAFCGWFTALALTVSMYYNQLTINIQNQHIDYLQQKIKFMETIMRGQDQMTARKAVAQYAMTRTTAWLHQFIPSYDHWGPHVGPLTRSSDHEGLMVVVMGWTWGDNQPLALQLTMPALGDVNEALWFIPKGLDSKRIIEYAHPVLYRLLRPTEWDATEQEIASLLSAATALSGVCPVPENFVRPVTTIRG